MTRYTSISRFTDPGASAELLDVLPDDPRKLAEVAQNLTVHHNLLAHLGVPNDVWDEIPTVWPPKAEAAIQALSQTGPGDLLGPREATQRLRGACMAESHLLATFLRYRNISTRIRAGYFENVYSNEDHLVAFWERNARARGVAADLLAENPERWREVNHEYTRAQVAADKHVEHWIAEVWDASESRWRLLDANTQFLQAMSDIEVDLYLSPQYFEYAHEAWMKMRTSSGFNPEQYEEWPQDGRSHIRSQLLWDFCSLLNHDIAGYDQSQWSNQQDSDEIALTSEQETFAFIKETAYEEVSQEEIEMLDALARLLRSDPDVDNLVAFYRGNRTRLPLPSIEQDPKSFVFGAN